MKLLNHPIAMIAIYDKEGNIKPFRFKHEDKTITVQRVLKSYEEKIAGNKRIVFVCMHNGKDIYELKYELSNHKWFLFKR